MGSGIGWWYDGIFAAVLGMITASFLCVCAERIPRKMSIGGRSRCACGRMLRIGENIPVLGWVRARGTASCCGAQIPTYYVKAEIGMGVAWGISGSLLSTNAIAAGVVGIVSVVAVVALGVVALNKNGSADR
jgi:prepilin signal peptidase PulO-like enzyme (type II secretory pathway)